jgi:Spy/CpxP family protein refolding chaperone
VAGVVAIGAAVHAQGPGLDGPGGQGRPFDSAQGRRFGHFGGPGGDLPLRALELTDEQRQQVRAITDRHKTNMQSAGQQLRQAFEAQRTAIQTSPVDESQIRSTTEALATAQTAMAIERAQIRSEILAILTPDQQQKLSQIQAEREARRKQRMDRVQKRRQG